MNQWVFVIAAYGLVLGSTGVLVAWSAAAMRRAETAADAVRDRP